MTITSNSRWSVWPRLTCSLHLVRYLKPSIPLSMSLQTLKTASNPNFRAICYSRRSHSNIWPKSRTNLWNKSLVKHHSNLHKSKESLISFWSRSRAPSFRRVASWLWRAHLRHGHLRRSRQPHTSDTNLTSWETSTSIPLSKWSKRYLLCPNRIQAPIKHAKLLKKMSKLPWLPAKKTILPSLQRKAETVPWGTDPRQKEWGSRQSGEAKGSWIKEPQIRHWVATE